MTPTVKPGKRLAMISHAPLCQILAEYRARLEELLGDALDSVLMYGSHSRGEATDDSDIDVLCLMKIPFDYGELILRTGPISAALSLQYNVVISTAFATRKDYENRNTPFLMNVRREAVPI